MLPHHFNLLKKRVLDTAKLTNFTSSDCKTLSALIFIKTKKRLSETTLKRVYGFAHSKFQSSQFTIDTLADYCGYKNWMAFLNEHTSQPQSGKTADWINLSNDASRITSLTLRALQKRSGVPYKKTIKRKFIDEHLESFLSSEYIATALIAPSGHGKSIALLHWIEERLLLNAYNNINDIILFFSTSSLMSVLSSGQDIHTWLLSLLGYNRTEILNMLLHGKEKSTGKFFLIIDGFDEHLFNTDQFQLVLTQVMDIFSLYEKSDAFRIIFTMRSDTWINNQHALNNDEKRWFTGYNTNYDTFSNVPLFTHDELYDLCYGLNPLVHINIDAETINVLANPLYFQIYYKLNRDHFSLNNIGQLYRYEIVSSFILDKIYLDKHSSEKILFLYELVDMMCLKKGIYHVDKIKADALFERHNYVYHELLGLEFLTEFNKSVDFQHNTYIEFGNKDFLEYIIAQKLLADNDNQFNLKLIQDANLLLNNDLKLDVIKWVIVYAIKTDPNYNLNHLVSAELPLNKKAELINFIGEIFNAPASAAPGRHLFRSNFDNELFNFFFGLEYISVEYEKTLQTLLRFDLSNEKQILVRCCLAMISIVKMDLKAIDAQIINLKKIPQIDFFKYPIDPLSCLDAIYHYLKYGIIKKDALIDITKFYFNPLTQINGLTNTIANDIIYILAARTLQISARPQKVIRFIQVLNKHYKDFSNFATEYTFFLKNILADAYFVLNDKKNLLDTYKSILKLGNYYDDSYTPYISIFYHSLNIKVALIKHEYESISAEYKCFAHIADKHELKLEKFYLISLMLKKGPLTAELELSQFYKQLYYERSKLTVQLGITELLERQEI
ncbi:hypothetical protein [Mucilaginibacter sp. dw_454]|uniref:hypothetical protein n=1 Tax=Mucilaginibacter sp. dw_454 TaxID=2720079 RepID=UPI001BD38910|nr:hypothetical protein [Mucilaginibacter sp. dw_454]